MVDPLWDIMKLSDQLLTIVVMAIFLRYFMRERDRMDKVHAAELAKRDKDYSQLARRTMLVLSTLIEAISVTEAGKNIDQRKLMAIQFADEVDDEKTP